MKIGACLWLGNAIISALILLLKSMITIYFLQIGKNILGCGQNDCTLNNEWWSRANISVSCCGGLPLWRYFNGTTSSRGCTRCDNKGKDQTGRVSIAFDVYTSYVGVTTGLILALFSYMTKFFGSISNVTQ